MNGKEKSTERDRNRSAHQNRETTIEKGSRETSRGARQGSLKSFIDENRSLDILALFTKIYARL